MKLADITSPYDIFTGKIVVTRDIPYITDRNIPEALECAFSTNIVSTVAAPGSESGLKHLLGLEHTIELTYRLQTTVSTVDEDQKVQLFEVYCEVTQILLYVPEHYESVTNETVQQYISEVGLPAAWVHWRAQAGSIFAAAQLPVPFFPPHPPEHMVERAS